VKSWTKAQDFNKRWRGFIRCSVMSASLLAGFWPVAGLAQDGHPHGDAQEQLSAEQLAKRSELIQRVRKATDKFQDVNVAIALGYQLAFGCVSGPDQGAMGLHFVNGKILGKNVVDVDNPPIVIYEPTLNGQLKLIGADYLVDQATWDANKDKSHPDGPPQLMGQLFHLFEAPNRFALPAFYTLHVWAWKANPNGAFVNWHPNVSCQLFNPPTVE
jgi:hypothetical protein